MLEIGHRTPCFAYGEPPYNSELFLQMRRHVSVPTDQYFRWLYRAVWDCDVTMIGYYQTDPDDRGVRTHTTFTGLTKVGAVNSYRENKYPQYNTDGTTTLVPDPSFNSYPNVYGQIPENWLMQQRYNLCVSANVAVVYFDVRYRRTGELIGVTGLDDPTITTWAGAPANVSEISITSIVSDETRYFYADYTVTFPFYCYLSVESAAGSNYYDPNQNKIWPMLLFDGSPATVNWKGLVPADADQPSTHPTTTALEVDGVTIPSGTSWGLYGTSGQLNISVKWKIARDRDL